jgi:nicotinate-nucleotide adenylyltransferase
VDADRLGLFGGTFDPPHRGHVAALEAAWRTGRFARLLVTVAGEPYQKTGDRSLSPATDRLAMAVAAFAALPGVEVSDREITRRGPTYTIDTVRELRAEGWRVELLVGADAAAALDGWHEAATLAELVTIGVFPRASTVPVLSARWRAEVLEMDPVDLSSTEIREGALDEAALARRLPPAVIPLWRRLRG